MAGIRIQHELSRNARFTITEPDHPYDRPYQCTPPEFGGCGAIHLFKTHHLNVGEDGACIVNHVLYDKIKLLLGAAGFRETNVVDKPPTQGIGAGAFVPGSGQWGNIPIIRK